MTMPQTGRAEGFHAAFVPAAFVPAASLDPADRGEAGHGATALRQQAGTAGTAGTGTLTAVQEKPPAPQISLVIPTFNEAGNVAELLDRLSAAIPDRLAAEILFVDDSTDHTPEVIADTASRCRIPVSVHHREAPTGGLGGAVAEGFRRASAPWIVVMDADLQHPPGLVPELVAVGERTGADLVVASRYADGGSRHGLAGGYRVAVSGASTMLAKVAFPRRLRAASDPMSGFFAVRRGCVDPDRLRPVGYKILLELIVRCRLDRIAEVPYRFQERFAGESKSGLREGLRFVRHLLGLRLCAPLSRLAVFGLIGLSGVLPNLATMWLLTTVLGTNYLFAAVLANQVAVAWNFLLLELTLFRARRHRHWATRFGKFAALANADLLLRVPALAALVEYGGLGVLTSTVIALTVSFALRFTITESAIYAPPGGPTRGAASRRVPSGATEPPFHRHQESPWHHHQPEEDGVTPPPSSA